MQDQVATLEVQLQEKEELVAVLTQRLEQAAEQLDRIQRTGGDRGLRLGGGLPPELIESHKTLVEDLQQAVGQWEQMQAAATLERLEVQVSGIRDLIADNFTRAVVVQTSSQPFGDALQDCETDESIHREDEPASVPDAELDCWESLKAGLLAADTGPYPEEEARAEEIAEHDPPQSIDFSTAGPEELQAAVEDRDEYISFLIKRLRIVESRQSVAPPDWAALDNAPEELRQRLQELESRLEGTLRISEVELSLERARLSREEMKLRQIQEQIEKKMRSLGLSLEDGIVSYDKGAAGCADEAKGHRWLRFLGIGGNEEDEDDD